LHRVACVLRHYAAVLATKSHARSFDLDGLARPLLYFARRRLQQEMVLVTEVGAAESSLKL